MSIALQTTSNHQSEVTIDNPLASVGERLQSETTAVRMKIHWPGVRKTLSQDQNRQAAGTFSADTKSLSTSKKLFDTRHPAFRAATAVKSQASDYWKSVTLRRIVANVGPQDLRDRPSLRDRVSEQLSQVEASLDDWMTDRPRRSIIRRSK